MKELFNRIIAWGEPKGIYNIEYVALIQIGFLLKELAEVNDEFIAGNIDKAVGEICDLIVYSVNALVLLDRELSSINEITTLGASTIHDRNKKDEIHLMSLLLHSISEMLISAKSKWQVQNEYIGLIERCQDVIFALNYSPEIALEETIKKIESRRGVMNPATGKWEKFQGQADVYVPDYSKARMK